MPPAVPTRRCVDLLVPPFHRKVAHRAGAVCRPHPPRSGARGTGTDAAAAGPERPALRFRLGRDFAAARPPVLPRRAGRLPPPLRPPENRLTQGACPMQIGLLLFPALTQLDLTGPYEVFARLPGAKEIGRASCRERVCQYV